MNPIVVTNVVAANIFSVVMIVYLAYGKDDPKFLEGFYGISTIFVIINILCVLFRMIIS